jgi:hypothetical protein
LHRSCTDNLRYLNNRRAFIILICPFSTPRARPASIAFESPETELEKLHERLRKMSDAGLPSQRKMDTRGVNWTLGRKRLELPGIDWNGRREIKGYLMLRPVKA